METTEPTEPGSSNEAGDDEVTGMWAALNRLPTYERMRATILGSLKGSRKEYRQVDVKDVDHSQYLTDRVFKLNNPSEDNEEFLSKLRNRIENAGVELPSVEVRYENLTVKGKVHVGGRALPSLSNTVLDFVDTVLKTLRLYPDRKTDLTILNGVTGILKPGRMTLLLGPPSSGKSTLLRALSGQLDPNLDVQGTISYNGHGLDEFVPKKTAAYISQTDLHIAELTVRETMNFSARFQGVGTRFDTISELLKKEKELGISPDPEIDFYMKASAVESTSSNVVTEYYLKIMGLDICADTVVGDQMLKGISGGQKKRLTTAEMIVGPARALFMDEISTGLDSSTTFQVVKCIGQFASLMGETVLMSLLQPAPETYNLFDDVILLSGGQIVYHGPRENVLEFFQSCGFRCPPRKGTADFLQEVTSLKDQEQYWADKSRPYEFVPVKHFAEAYSNFQAARQMHQELATPFDKSKSHKAALAFDTWLLPQWDLFKIYFEKELLLLKRNYAITVYIMSQLMVIGGLTATLYFRTENHHRSLDDAQKLSGALFVILTLSVFTGYGEITFTALRLPVFYKFRELTFFPPWAWALSMFIIKIPLAIVETFLYSSISYYVIGFAPLATRFFKLWLILALSDQMASALFRMIAGFCRTMVLASSIGGFFIMAVFTLGGYVIPRTDIRGWWIWAYWATPLSYGQNAAAVNEFLAHQWRKPLPNDTHTLGHRFILSLGLYDHGYWYWIAVGALTVYLVVYSLLFAGAITFLSAPEQTRAVISRELLSEIHANLTGEIEAVESGTKPVSLPRSISNILKSGSSASRRQASVKEDQSIEPSADENIRRSQASTSSRSFHRDDSSNTSAGGAARMPRGMILPFQPFSISFEDIGYAVDMPAGHRDQGATEDKLQLLSGISGAFRPGCLTALMGVTGAGKSTLMDVLSGRKSRGYVEGDIRINGFPKNQETYTRIAGYCEQNDIHSPQITVHESLVFSGWLRLQPEISSEMKTEFVNEVMDLVELTSLKDALVGVPGQTGLSTEQRKRLTIAVELVANPSIIFMDEPTSGLDARAAATVMRAVRNTVDTGRTVVCTIHQPSIDIFESFDELLLLKRGGQTIYAGPLGRQSRKLIKYFQGVADVPAINEGDNPAAWMLEITTPGMEQKLGVDFAEIYRKSSAYEQTKELVKELSTPPPGTQDISFPSKFAQSQWNQFTSLLWKQHWTYWRSPGYNMMRFGLAMTAALFMGTVFWGLGKKTGTQRSLFSLMGSIYTSHSFYGVLTAGAVQPLISSERTVFYRERSAGMYAETPYALAQCLIELPYVFGSSSLFVLLEYAMIKLEWDAGKFFWYWFFTFTSQVTFVYWGMLTVALTPNAGVGAILAGFAYQLWSMFNGFAIPHPKFPVWWKWAYWCNPSAYTLYGTIVSQFGDLSDVNAVTQTGMLVTVKQLIRRSYGFKHDFLWFIGSMAAFFPFIFAVGFIVCIKLLNYQQR